MGIQACVDSSTIFTMQDRDDGWNDVRNAIVTFKKERVGALDQLKSLLKRDTDAIKSSAAGRWSRVLAEELINGVGVKLGEGGISLSKGVEAPSVSQALQALSPLPKEKLEEVMSRDYATEKQLQVALAMEVVARLIPEGKKPTKS